MGASLGLLLVGAAVYGGVKLSEAEQRREEAENRIRQAQREMSIQVAKRKDEEFFGDEEKRMAGAKQQAELKRKRALAAKAQGRESTLLDTATEDQGGQYKTLLGE